MCSVHIHLLSIALINTLVRLPRFVPFKMPRKRKPKGSKADTNVSKRRKSTRQLSKTVERRPLPGKVEDPATQKIYTPTLQTLQAFLRQHLDKQIILSKDECNVLKKILKHTKCLIKQKGKESEYMEISTPTFIGQKQLIYYCNGDEQILEYLPLKLEGFLVKTKDDVILNLLVLLKEDVLGSRLSNEQCRKNIAKLIGSDKIKFVADSSADKLEDIDSISSFDSIEGFTILSSLHSKNFNGMEAEAEAESGRSTDTSSTLKFSCIPSKTAYAVNDAVVAFDINSKEFRAGKVLSLETDKQECKIAFNKGESFSVPVSHVLPYNFKSTLQCPICRVKLPRYTGNARRRDFHVFEHLNKEHYRCMKIVSNTKDKRTDMQKNDVGRGPTDAIERATYRGKVKGQKPYGKKIKRRR